MSVCPIAFGLFLNNQKQCNMNEENILIERSEKTEGIVPVSVTVVPNDAPQKAVDFLKPSHSTPQFKVAEIQKFSEGEIAQIAKRHMLAQLEVLKIHTPFKLMLEARYPQAIAGSFKGGQYMRKQAFTELRRCLPPPNYGFRTLVDMAELEKSL